MSVPISWLASALPASVAIRASTQAWKGTSQFFGHLVNPNLPAPAANGLSAPIAEASRESNPDFSTTNPSDGLAQVQERLEQLLHVSRSAFGISRRSQIDSRITVSVSMEGKVKTAGAEPLRTNLEVQIQNDPSLLQHLRKLGYASQNGFEIQVQ